MVPAHTVAAAALPLCWVWPVLLWSRLGTEEIDVLASYPRRRTRILATWLAGVLLTAAAGAVPLIRLLAVADGRGAAAWLAGALFIPAMAYLLGAVTRSSSPFEVIYLLWWYAIVNGGPSPAVVASAAAALFLGTAAWQELKHTHR